MIYLSFDVPVDTAACRISPVAENAVLRWTLLFLSLVSSSSGSCVTHGDASLWQKFNLTG